MGSWTSSGSTYRSPTSSKTRSPSAHALASSSPAYEAIQAVGEPGFLKATPEQARGFARDGLLFGAEIAVVGYLARKPHHRRRSTI
ncbi:MAG: hypothetical protein ABI468_08855 [Candidatus Nanopelagicales bacterium]